MTRDEAIEVINQKEPTFLTKVGEINITLPEGGTLRVGSYQCPYCGYTGGDGEHRGQALKLDPHTVAEHPRWKCFNCGKMNDVAGLWMVHKNKTGKEAFDALYKEYDINIDENNESDCFRTAKKKMKGVGMSRDVNSKCSTNASIKVDYSDYFKRCAERIEQTSYHRGISLETLKRFEVGYDPEWKHPKVKDNIKVPTSPRLIIPTGNDSYVARDTRADGDILDFNKKFVKMAVGSRHIFNERALKEATQPIFVVEGEIDALSIIDVGGEAIGIGGISSRRMVLQRLKEKKPVQPLILVLDADDAGIKAMPEFENGLNEIGIPFYKPKADKWTAPYKDANEWLMSCRDVFALNVRDEAELATQQDEVSKNIERETLTNEFNKECAVYCVDEFLNSIKSNTVSAIPTGFDDLDNILDGGLNAGLYIVGAISSLGKTTLCLQIADNIAKSGCDVLIFSLEMARNELMAKSISRLTFMLDEKKGENAKTTRGIMKGGLYNVYNDDELKLIDNAVKYYKGFADHIFIVEGVGDVTVKKISERVQRHKDATGRVPVVLVDYLQIIAPGPLDARSTDKQIVDKAVLSLKRLSRDFSTPVIGISSFNRDNYYQSVNLTSFKESGAIEYSSDVLIGLQYKLPEKNNQKSDDEAKNRKDIIDKTIKNTSLGRPIEIELKVLKNRNGARGDIVLDFYPMFNAFKPHTKRDKDCWVDVNE